MGNRFALSWYARFCCTKSQEAAGLRTDEKTAVRIAEAVLSAQYGEETVKAQLPLHTRSTGDYWIVQLQGVGPASSKGGGPAVWINRHSGCLKVMERMK